MIRCIFNLQGCKRITITISHIHYVQSESIYYSWSIHILCAFVFNHHESDMNIYFRQLVTVSNPSNARLSMALLRPISPYIPIQFPGGSEWLSDHTPLQLIFLINLGVPRLPLCLKSMLTIFANSVYGMIILMFARLVAGQANKEHETVNSLRVSIYHNHVSKHTN